MTNKQLGPKVRTWLKDADRAPQDVRRSVAIVSGEAEHTRQRGRWWPLPSFRRQQKPTGASQATRHQAGPGPAADDPTPTVTGRTRSMFSPVKAITAGALVFAVGGAFLVAQPFQQQSVVPGAESQVPPTPVGFSSTYDWRNQSTAGSSEALEDGVSVVAGEGWAFSNLDSSDPRFAGPLALTSNIYRYPGEGSISVGSYRIETTDGAWQQLPTASIIFEDDALLWRRGQLPPADNIQFGTFVGEGDYEGLIAVYQETWWPDGGAEVTIRLDGYVIDGDLPDAPEPWMP